jgi:hypothetical protein
VAIKRLSRWQKSFVPAERKADQRQEACNPAKARARQQDVAVVQNKQDPDQPQRKSYSLQPRDFSPMKRLASVEVTMGWSPRTSAQIPAG